MAKNCSIIIIVAGQQAEECLECGGPAVCVRWRSAPIVNCVTVSDRKEKEFLRRPDATVH